MGQLQGTICCGALVQGTMFVVPMGYDYLALSCKLHRCLVHSYIACLAQWLLQLLDLLQCST